MKEFSIGTRVQIRGSEGKTFTVYTIAERDERDTFLVRLEYEERTGKKLNAGWADISLLTFSKF